MRQENPLILLLSLAEEIPDIRLNLRFREAEIVRFGLGGGMFGVRGEEGFLHDRLGEADVLVHPILVVVLIGDALSEDGAPRHGSEIVGDVGEFLVGVEEGQDLGDAWLVDLAHGFDGEIYGQRGHAAVAS